jgi:hypothetical protein
MPDTSEITKTEYEVLAEFRYTLRLFMSFSETAAKEVGITPQAVSGLTGDQRFSRS